MRGNKRRKVVLSVVALFLLSSTGTILGAGNDLANDSNNENLEIQKYSISLPPPRFVEEEKYVRVNLEGTGTYWSHCGAPMIPVIIKTFDYPLGTKIHNVDVNIQWEKYTLDKKVIPAPVAIPLTLMNDPDSSILEEKRIDEDIYSSSELYPKEPYLIKYGAGIKNMEHVVFVNVKCFAQYSPANDYINIPTRIDITVEYETGETPTQSKEQYDLIIITHKVFEDELQPLVEHKEEHGITTKLITVDEIYEQYQSKSQYDWERIKMFLADHVLEWDTKFVMLAGGRKGQTHEWYVPDFRSHNNDPSDEYWPMDKTYSCDLYFADLYGVDQYGNTFFDDWDSNDDGLYAAGPLNESETDYMDYYPDVHIGRLPLRYGWEADVVVDKIIYYENNADDSWFKKAVLAGGDGFPPERYPGIARPGIYEGEIFCDTIAEILANRGVESIKCYCSDQGDIDLAMGYEGMLQVYDELSKGCGFATFTGHSCPLYLGSYEPNTGISPEPPLTPFYNGLDQALKVNNGYKLPLMINNGCHNAQFDVTLQKLIDYIYGVYPEFYKRLGWMDFIPHDASSWFVLMKGGGAIGVIGNTALGAGYVNGAQTRLADYFNQLCYEGYAFDNNDFAGELLSSGFTKYNNEWDPQGDFDDRKTVEEKVLLGDPSLKLGGYKTGSSSSPSEDDERTEDDYGSVYIETPTWQVGDRWTYILNNIDINLTGAEGREIILQLSSGDIVLKVIDVTSDSYVASLTTDNIDVTFEVAFDSYVEDAGNTSIPKNISVPKVSLDNVSIDGEITFDKESLGIKDIELVFTVDLMENLDTIEDIMGMELPRWIEKIAPFISIPANIQVNLEFDKPFEILQFPLEKDKIWGVPPNKVTINIDGSIESIWLRILNFVNKFIPIVPPEFAKYLPNVDISEVLNDYGIPTQYQIDTPEIPDTLLRYHKYAVSLFWVKGSETVETPAGSFDAAIISHLADNGETYYSESVGNIVKFVAHLNEYIPIIEDISLELKE